MNRREPQQEQRKQPALSGIVTKDSHIEFYGTWAEVRPPIQKRGAVRRFFDGVVDTAAHLLGVIR